MWFPVSTRLGLLAIASAGFWLSCVDAKLYNNLDEFATSPDSTSQYDFVIIGGMKKLVISSGEFVLMRRVYHPQGGTAGNEGILEILVPGLITTIPRTYDWNFTTIPQTFVNNRSLTYQRGFVLGGSSAVNSLSYTRGSKDDYDLWGKASGDSRTWSWDSLLPYMFKTEKWTPPVGGRDATGQYDPRYHGKNGPIGVSLTWSGPDDFDRRSTQNTQVQPEFKEILDVNAGRPIGLAWTQWTIGGGERNSAASGYLPTPTRQRPNLTIVVNAQVRRVVPTSRKHGGKLNVRTVEIGSRSSATTLNVTARKEVVLSAGTFGTPHLLLNSGIGEKAHLDSVGVTTIHNLPSVGKGMTDHPAVFLMWTTNATDTPVDVDAALAQWNADRTGPMAENYGIGRRFLWSRLPKNSSLLRKYGDPSSGSNSPHLEFTVGKSGSFVAALVALLTPHSRGSIKLASNNPFDAPLIDPNYFSHPFDIEALAEGVRIAQRWYSGPVWDGFITGYLGPNPNNATALKDSTVVWLHPVGTASMSARDGVVDKDLKVKGLDGLRIVDASVIPYVPTAHTQAPTYILAERGAELIRASL
ncbi:hypothetical protein H1R20_g10532, partial [Candolleomyces eurysporus]